MVGVEHSVLGSSKERIFHGKGSSFILQSLSLYGAGGNWKTLSEEGVKGEGEGE